MKLKIFLIYFLTILTISSSLKANWLSNSASSAGKLIYNTDKKAQERRPTGAAVTRDLAQCGIIVAAAIKGRRIATAGIATACGASCAAGCASPAAPLVCVPCNVACNTSPLAKAGKMLATILGAITGYTIQIEDVKKIQSRSI